MQNNNRNSGANRGTGNRGQKFQPDNAQINDLLHQVSQKLNTDPNQLRNSAQSGDPSKLLSSLNPQDAQKLQKVLSDKDATEKLLATPQAQALLKKLLEGK